MITPTHACAHARARTHTILLLTSEPVLLFLWNILSDMTVGLKATYF